MIRGCLVWNLARYQKVRRDPFLLWRSCRNYSTSFCIALSASQVYRAQTLRQKHDPLWGYQRQPYSRQKDGVCWLVFRGSFPGFGIESLENEKFLRNKITSNFQSGFNIFGGLLTSWLQRQFSETDQNDNEQVHKNGRFSENEINRSWRSRRQCNLLLRHLEQCVVWKNLMSQFVRLFAFLFKLLMA